MDRGAGTRRDSKGGNRAIKSRKLWRAIIVDTSKRALKEDVYYATRLAVGRYESRMLVLCVWL